MSPRSALSSYRGKRDFRSTPEPKGKRRKSNGRRFILQKHDSTRLHFDFRLEWDGVLKSRAIPKEPSLDPSVKRLVVRTEDHPVEYVDFEGVIPKGYGAGTVILWDRGEWTPEGNPEEGFTSGELKFQLHGERLKGGFALVRMKGRKSNVENWLLVKEHDKYVKKQTSLTRKWQRSVVSGRTVKQISKEDEDRNAIQGVRLTHPSRMVFPNAKATKRDVAEYYAKFAEHMIDHLRDQPVSLVRCPEGRTGECFYQKHYTGSLPEAVDCIEIKEANGKKAPYLLINTPQAIISAIQIGAIEFHVWGARKDKLERPDRLVFDLDPDTSLKFSKVRSAAMEMRETLSELGLQSFALLTGGKGIHVVVPLTRRREWDEVKLFAKGLANRLADSEPDRYTATAFKQERTGKIFIDWLRNARGATAIAPYSLRARPGASVATPLSWEELSNNKHADQYKIGNIAQRMAHLKSDPWADYRTVRQSPTKAMLKTVN